ncbi:MAG: pilus assembly protein [Pirellulaceae bacterium]|nr:pilus assembly protein [Planctomycetales bacterium]
MARQTSKCIGSVLLQLKNGRRNRRRTRLGAAAVEFAIVAPIFILLVFGMIEYGRMVMVQQVITNASREGARVAVVDGSTTTTVEDTVDDFMVSANITGYDVVVTPDPPADAGYGESVSVTVSVPFSQVSWLPSPMYLGGTQMTSTTVMRRESSQ